MNTELLEKIAAHIEAHPESFHMGDWDCGTTACIAGWALRLTNTPQNKWGDGGRYTTPACRVLGIPEEEATTLFFTSEWPKRFWVRYWGPEDGAAPSAEEQAQIAAARIRHFIATEGAE